MSGSGDNFLARWSRRKQAVEAAEPPRESVAERAAAEPPGPSASEESSRPDATGPNGAEPLEPLPRIEDLTAESDLTAFLREGMPEALKRAAMRRMWSLDPVIRDYVGPSEYAWDYNNPSSIPGFGPAAPASSVEGLIAQLKATRPAAPGDTVDTSPRPRASPPVPGRAGEGATDAAVAEHPASVSDSPLQTAGPPEPTAEPASGRDKIAAASPEPTPVSEKPEKQAAFRHGRALPR